MTPRPGAALGLVADLWRYPVKSLGGERLRRTFVGPYGPLGDRRHALVAADGEVISARRRLDLLAYRARYADQEAVEAACVAAPDGRVLTVEDPALGGELSALLGRDAVLQRCAQAFHDIAPVSLVTLQSIAAIGERVGADLDVRRFRPNLVVELEVPVPFAESTWPGLRVRIGPRVEALVVIETERCAVTTVDPDTMDRDRDVHSAIARARDNLFGVYLQVLAPGWVAVGDPLVVAASA